MGRCIPMEEGSISVGAQHNKGTVAVLLMGAAALPAELRTQQAVSISPGKRSLQPWACLGRAW